MRRLVLVADGGPMTDERQFPLGGRVDNLDVSGVHLHGANLGGAKLTDAYLCGADISGDIEGLRVNEVEIEPLVQVELDRRFPELVKLRSTDVEGLRAASSMKISGPGRPSKPATSTKTSSCRK